MRIITSFHSKAYRFILVSAAALVGIIPLPLQAAVLRLSSEVDGSPVPTHQLAAPLAASTAAAQSAALAADFYGFGTAEPPSDPCPSGRIFAALPTHSARSEAALIGGKIGLVIANQATPNDLVAPLEGTENASLIPEAGVGLLLSLGLALTVLRRRRA